MPIVAHVCSLSIRKLAQTGQDLKARAREMVQCVKQLPHKHEDIYLVGKALNLKFVIEETVKAHEIRNLWQSGPRVRKISWKSQISSETLWLATDHFRSSSCYLQGNELDSSWGPSLVSWSAGCRRVKEQHLDFLESIVRTWESPTRATSTGGLSHSHEQRSS